MGYPKPLQRTAGAIGDFLSSFIFFPTFFFFWIPHHLNFITDIMQHFYSDFVLGNGLPRSVHVTLGCQSYAVLCQAGYSAAMRLVLLPLSPVLSVILKAELPVICDELRLAEPQVHFCLPFICSQLLPRASLLPSFHSSTSVYPIDCFLSKYLPTFIQRLKCNGKRLVLTERKFNTSLSSVQND